MCTHHGKVNRRVCNDVRVVRQDAKCDVRNDLDELRIGVTSRLDDAQIFVGYVATFVRDLRGELHGRRGLWIIRATISIGGHFRFVELCYVLSQIAVRRHAIVAAVDFGDGESNALADLYWKLAFCQAPARLR